MPEEIRLQHGWIRILDYLVGRDARETGYSAFDVATRVGLTIDETAHILRGMQAAGLVHATGSGDGPWLLTDRGRDLRGLQIAAAAAPMPPGEREQELAEALRDMIEASLPLEEGASQQLYAASMSTPGAWAARRRLAEVRHRAERVLAKGTVDPGDVDAAIGFAEGFLALMPDGANARLLRDVLSERGFSPSGSQSAIQRGLDAGRFALGRQMQIVLAGR